MKIDRRGFLSFVAGGAVGTVLSPLPWKLMDDISIWSQVWPWVPVPKYGESKYVKSSCSLCSGNCGINVRKVDDRAVKIEGLSKHPVNSGGICGLGLSGLQFLYGPSRVKTPMKSIGERGSGQWKKISWDEAISIVVKKLVSIDSSNNKLGVGCISGLSRGTVSELVRRFFRAYGSPNFSETYSSRDMFDSVLKKICKSDTDVSVCFDLENADYILSLGSGLFDGWVSPVRMMKLKEKWDRDKVTLVQVETMLSNTAAKANSWISIKPGMEADLAFGIAAFMIKEGKYEKDFVISHFPEFDKWKESFLSKYPLKIVSETTGIDLDTIMSLSKSFTEAASPLALCGRGKGQIPSSSREYMSVCLLNLLKGNLNKTGGMNINKSFDYIDWSSSNENIDSKKIGKDLSFTVDQMISDLKTKVLNLELMFFVDSNPIYTLSDVSSVKKSFNDIPFLVSFSSFMDETTVQSDLVLPSHIYLERIEDRDLSKDLGKAAIGLSRPVVSAEFDTRHFGDVVIELAHAIGGKMAEFFPWKDYEDCLKATMGEKWDSLVDHGFWVGETLKPVQLNELDFSEINSEVLKIEGDSKLFPLVLVPYDCIRISSNYIATPPFLVKTIADTTLKGKMSFVSINPQTAEFIGVKEGGYAVLITPKGEARVRINLCYGIRQGVIVMVRGLGHTAYDDYIAGKGVNVNSLVGPTKDSSFGYDAAWGIRANLTKA